MLSTKNSYVSNALILQLGWLKTSLYATSAYEVKWCGISACITEMSSCSKENQINCKGQFHVKFNRHLAFLHCRYSFELEVKAI